MNEFNLKPAYLIYAGELRGVPSEIQTDIAQSQNKTFITLSVVTVSIFVTMNTILDRQAIQYM